MGENRDRIKGCVHTVVKVGGRAWAEPGILAPIADVLARANRILVVPGGGSLADRIRELDSEFGLSDSAAHWMAIRAMDQAAWLLADRIPQAVVVTRFDSIPSKIDRGEVPVLAPSDCLLQADPLPHSWDATSDSIAAWVAGELGASKLVLVKPPEVRAWTREALVDAHFHQAIPHDVDWHVVPADDVERLRGVL